LVCEVFKVLKVRKFIKLKIKLIMGNENFVSDKFKKKWYLCIWIKKQKGYTEHFNNKL